MSVSVFAWSAKPWSLACMCLERKAGGEGGIRTLDTLARIPVFETGLFSHSSTSPELQDIAFGIGAHGLAGDGAAAGAPAGGPAPCFQEGGRVGQGGPARNGVRSKPLRTGKPPDRGDILPAPLNLGRPKPGPIRIDAQPRFPLYPRSPPARAPRGRAYVLRAGVSHVRGDQDGRQAIPGGQG